MVLLLFPYNSYAIGQVKIDPASPLLTDLPYIAKVYQDSCNAGSNENSITEKFPMYMVDKLSDQYQKQYTKEQLKMWFNIHFFVSAGYDFGRTLALTDYDGNLIEDMCKNYSVNFAAEISNNQENWPYSKNPPSPNTNVTSPIFSNPFNDLFAVKEKNQIMVTPRIAQQNGCRYMYVSMAMHPTPSYNYGASDATLDIMEHMLWDDYSKNVIKDAYPHLLQGAKFGRYLFDNQLPLKGCYD